MATPRRKKVSVSGKQGDVRRILTITVDADDDTLNRLATLMLFAKAPSAWQDYVEPPLPWPLGEEGKPEEVTPRPPEEVIRHDITKRFTYYINRHGTELAKNFLAEYGATKVSELLGEALYLFHADLVRSTPQYEEAGSAS